MSEVSNLKCCTVCGIDKTLDSFHKCSKYKSGRQSDCKDCRKEKNKGYYLKNKERINARNNEWNKSNIEFKRKIGREYYNNNKDKYQEYRLSNSDKERERKKNYRENNREIVNQRSREYKRRKADERGAKRRTGDFDISKYRKEYYKTNKDKIYAYRKDNADKISEKRRQYVKNKKISNPLYKLTTVLRARIVQAFKKTSWKKGSKTQDLLGAPYETVKQHLQDQFREGMTWENHGKWHIDHIKPLSIAINEQELIELCHYTNLQPLWALENIIKGNKIITNKW